MSPLFDYKTISENLCVSSDVVSRLEAEARNEFPDDTMLRELHILRAVKAFARTNK
jgi:hypothetical protein